MALSSTPTDYSNLCTGRLAEKISPTTASGFIVTADTFTTPAGTGPATWPTGPQVWKISRKTRTTSEVEFVGVETASQSGSTVTTGTVNRYLPTNGSSLTSQGDGITFPAGSVVELVWHAYTAEKVPYKDIANTFTAKQTFSEGADFTSTTRPPKLPNLSQAQEDALSLEEGMMWKNTDTGTIRQYTGGTISSVGTDATANGSTTVAGKFEEATVAEQGTATATGGTGARLVVANANLVKTSSGAGDENKIPVLNADGALHINHIATGTPDGTKFVRDDGVLAVPAGSSYAKIVAISSGTSSSANTASSETVFDTFSYTADAGTITSTSGYRVTLKVSVTSVTTSTIRLGLQVGGTSTIFNTIAPSTSTTGSAIVTFTIMGTASAGSSVAVDCSMQGTYGANLGQGTYLASANKATNGTLTLVPSGCFGGSSSGSMVVTGWIVERISSVAF